MWSIVGSEDIFRGPKKKLPRKRPREVRNALLNLERYFDGLNCGIHPQTLKKEFEFVHGNYAHGLISIDQRGDSDGQGKLSPIRLYVFAHSEAETLYVICIGDKQTQKEDVRYAVKCVQEILAAE